MRVSTQPSAGGDRLRVVQTSPDSGNQRFDWLLQLCLLWLLAVSVWHLLGTEPQTTLGYRVRLSMIGTALSLSCGLWIASSPWSLPIKLVGISACLMAMLFAGIEFDRVFDAGNRILVPAQIQDGRIVHAGIGLSYAPLPNFQTNLETTISRSLMRRSHWPAVPLRLQSGELAVLCRMVEIPSSQETGRGPAWMMLEIQMGAGANLNALIGDVRREETKMGALPNVTIVRQTHCSRTAGLEMVGFEFVKEPEHLWARQVYLRTETCVLHFLLNTEVEADRPLFDEFLKSIRLE